jgi:integrase
MNRWPNRRGESCAKAQRCGRCLLFSGPLTKADVRRRRSVIHVLRHTFASLLLQRGESLMYVKEQMGHGSIQVTADVYGHLVPGGNRGAVDRLDERPSARVAKSLQSTEPTPLSRPPER